MYIEANATGESLYSYYLSLPGFSRLEAINTHGSRIIPQVSFDARKHPDVLLRIITEYDHCR